MLFGKDETGEVIGKQEGQLQVMQESWSKSRMSAAVNRSRLGDELDLEDERQEAEDGELIAFLGSFWINFVS